MSELTPEEPKTASKPKSKLRTVSLVIIALSIVIIVAVSRLGDDGTNAPPKPEHDSMSAYYMSQQFAEKQLIAPSTAKFPPYSQNRVADLGGGEYVISSYVDAQNSFGAMIRTQYLCTVKHVEGDRWQLLEFEFQ